MASFAINNSSTCCIGNSQICKDHRQVVSVSVSTSNVAAVKPRRLQVVSAASSMAVATASLPPFDNNNLMSFDKIVNEEVNDDIESSSSSSRVSETVSEKLDGWMRDSVGEIVKNLTQAPLLVQIYANNNGGTTEIKTERAVEANWPNLMRKKPSPDGVILVEELGEKELLDQSEDGDGTKAWGVLVQGKGTGGDQRGECGSACYLLKTSRVRGVGLFCTHFCLVKVKNFRDSARQQFTDSWLLQ